ncbi:3,9-dihydroxypterocarpan 6A-monooxygenase [Camellia lanceoleosa]|uniref:3,9-dihydroxypterocarpan 6A-monooxygenase n=1 Tax=Camellia lanceoleosa TaxID=1840588 RepID=A0ACC0FYY6_9ERIC|nr:3,9-dihydroxypterocarpan 6A-monooxygenase [Camellia lanceoleosa]
MEVEPPRRVLIFLQFLLKLKDDGDAKTPLTITHLKALLMDMVVGGTDTTSNTVEFALAEMMNKPQVLRKAQQEVETVVGKDNIVEESHIHKLPYLYASGFGDSKWDYSGNDFNYFPFGSGEEFVQDCNGGEDVHVLSLLHLCTLLIGNCPRREIGFGREVWYCVEEEGTSCCNPNAEVISTR